MRLSSRFAMLGASLLALPSLAAQSDLTALGIAGFTLNSLPSPTSASSIYVEPQDEPLLYEGQLPPGSPPVSNPFKANLERAIQIYRADWARLPDVPLASGPVLQEGSSGERVTALRARLGLRPDGRFDTMVAARVGEFRDAHGLAAGSHVDAQMVAALNRDPSHYVRILERNLAHAADLPDYLGHRYVHVDLATQRMALIEDGRVVDTMAVIAGKASSQTPAMAGLLRHAVLNPYWNVPPDLVRQRYARRIIAGGRSYLTRTGFQAMTGYEADAQVIPASEVDWHAVERGDTDVRLRQLPGPGNGMGDIKFMFPNSLGIYLHDTPSKHLFARATRLESAGCVRLERPMHFARWLFSGEVPAPDGSPEQIARLPFPVPIYLTYFTAMPSGAEQDTLRISYREDVYGFDRPDTAMIAP